MTCVLDASFALALVLPDETPPPDDMISTIVNEGVLVPAHWPSEIVNACVMAIRRGRLTRDEIMRALGDIAALNVEIAPADALDRSGALVERATRHGLSVYDTAYLELAERRNLPLATRDRRLAEAARSANVILL
jgi:predicted nucleic acid-binding protein